MTADKILSVAQKEIGTKESPANSNKVKYNTDYYEKVVYGDKYPWCCVFVWWVFNEANASSLFYGGNKTASCPTLMKYHTNARQNVKNNYQPGDIIFFNFSGGTSASHVGICEKWDGTNITTIDGNTGTDNESNGGAVMRRTRNKKYIVGAYRPSYNVDNKVKTYSINVPLLQKGSTGECVQSMQTLLTGNGYNTKGIDGKFGANTDNALRQFQKDKQLVVDGKCGQASWSALLGV